MAKPIWITNYNLGILENLTPISIELIATPVTPAISVTYSIVSGSLPTGTSLSSTGLLSGIVTTTYTNNTYNFKWAFCRYFWETHIDFPCINLDILEKNINLFL